MNGECLCGQVKFQITGSMPKLYQCHCTLCRKQGGSASNTATIVDVGNFSWVSGVETISSWVKDTGFRSDFCSKCGSPVPNSLRDSNYIWVPAGLLDTCAQLEVGAHLFVAFKADWDTDVSLGVKYETMPELAALIGLLHAQSRPLHPNSIQRPGTQPQGGASNTPPAVLALDVSAPEIQTSYPEPFASLVKGRTKRRIGDYFGLESFGVNWVRMDPGAISSALHHHSKEDEFVYVLEGSVTLVTDNDQVILVAGACAGFKAGAGRSHQLFNHSPEAATLLEVGSRIEGDEVVYPKDDLALTQVAGAWRFTHKDGTAYE